MFAIKSENGLFGNNKIILFKISSSDDSVCISSSL